MNRGNRREAIFLDEADRKRFLETLGEACLRTAWQVHAYCLMPNLFIWCWTPPKPTWWQATHGDDGELEMDCAEVANELGRPWPIRFTMSGHEDEFDPFVSLPRTHGIDAKFTDALTWRGCEKSNSTATQGAIVR